MTGIRQTDRLRERKPCADRQICPSDLCVVVVGVRNFRPTIWTSFSLKATIKQLVSVHIAFKCHSLSPSSYNVSCAESSVFAFRFELSSLWTFLLKATTSWTLFLRRTCSFDSCGFCSRRWANSALSHLSLAEIWVSPSLAHSFTISILLRYYLMGMPIVSDIL